MNHATAVLDTPTTPDYLGVLRHDCPRCGRTAAIRTLTLDGTHAAAYCEWMNCGFEAKTPRPEPS